MACGYLRASTDRQRNSVPVQHGIILEGAARFGLTLPEISEDYVYETPDPANQLYLKEHRHTITGCFFDAGVSAKKTRFLERPAVQRMLGYMMAKGIHRILVTKIDRNFRNTSDCLDTIEELHKHGIHFIIMNCAGGRVLDTTDAASKVLITTLAMMAEFESDIKRDRVNETKDFLKKDGKPIGHEPYGWKITSKKEPMTSIAAEQVVLRRLKEGDLSKAAGITLCEAARRLNAEGVPTKRGGTKWRASTVASVIKHARLAK